MIKRWPLSAKVLALAGAGLSFVAVTAVSGIIGNRADLLFGMSTSIVIKSIEANVGTWVVVVIICLVCLGLLFVWRIDRKRLVNSMGDLTNRLSSLTTEVSGLTNQISNLTTEIGSLQIKLDGNNQWFELADASMILMPSLISTQNIDTEMHRFIKKLLASATRVFSKVYGSSLFLPDIANKEDLTIWEHYQVPTDSVMRAKCYIGPARLDRKRGVAGEAFLKKEVIVAHITKEQDENGQWKFDKESYIPFTEEGTYPAFNSFACVPIIVGASSNDCLGVVCVDSVDIAAFDSVDVREILLRLGRYIGAALLIYRELQNRTKQISHPSISGSN